MPATTRISASKSRPEVDAPALRRALLAWFAREARDLPWRRTRDPYAILVSELMLQQTRVDVVIPYYERFLERFPDVAALAAAPESVVLAAWSGLGYYRRARYLHGAARAVVREHAGVFPREFEAILALPGVGRYTAGAVASIAFGRAVPLVDGNVARVFARWFALAGEQRSSAAQKRLWALADELLDRARPGDFNQALMELGACICTPRAPRCDACPVAKWCEAKSVGDPERFPQPRAQKAVIDVRLAVLALVDTRGRVGLVRRRAGTRMEGMLDLPGLELAADEDAPDELRRYARDAFHVTCATPACAGRARHTITHHRIAIEIYTARIHPARPLGCKAPREPDPKGIAALPDDAGYTLRDPHTLGDEGIANLTRKALRVANVLV